jgi:hypothetical protein
MVGYRMLNAKFQMRNKYMTIPQIRNYVFSHTNAKDCVTDKTMGERGSFEFFSSSYLEKKLMLCTPIQQLLIAELEEIVNKYNENCT